MIKQYITQAIAQLRQQPIISAVSVIGTALAIFLIMLVVMMQQVKTAPFAPESNRDRFLHSHNLSISHESWGKGTTSNGPMSVQSAKELWQSLKTPEAVTIYGIDAISTPVSLPKQAATSFDLRQTDDVFWKVFDFHFIDGKPYDKATFDAAIPAAVLSETVAQTLFGTTKGIVGKEFLLNHAPYQVCGVVKDVSTLATQAYGQLWVPYTAGGLDKDVWNTHMGMMTCILLAKSREDFPAIREEANRRLEEYNKIIGENGWKIISRNRPYDQETNAIAFGANVEPDLKTHRRQQLIIFLILLIVPAINISSMTQSRLRQRVSEIGVRRAFGSTRMEIMTQIITENFIVTLMAGALGLLMSVVFAYAGSSIIFAQEYNYSLSLPEVDSSMLLQADTFLWAFFFCFVLNLFSSGLPAWKASRIGIVNAISGKLH
jgi:putative ABC transport system permease protein